jgi:hypothetical protein
MFSGSVSSLVLLLGGSTFFEECGVSRELLVTPRL